MISVGKGVTRLGVPTGARVSAVNQCSVGVMAVLFRGQENSMETKWSLLSSREWWRPAVEGGVDGYRRIKQVPGWAADVARALLGCTQPGFAVLAISAPPAGPASHRENGKEKREGAKGHTGEGLRGR